MTAPHPNAPEVLRAEILVQARREAGETLRRAQQEADGLVAKAQAEAEQIRAERLARVRDEAERRADSLLATVPIETGRLRARRIEALLQEIYDEARRRLHEREGMDYRGTLIALTAEAVRQMAGDALVVKLAPEDRSAHGSAIVAALQQRASRRSLTLTLAEDGSISGGGVIVQDAEGRQVWDNRLNARLERLWPELRRQIAEHTGLVTDSSKGGDA